MGTPGTRTRNGKKPNGAHPAIAKLATAQRELKEALEQQAATAEILRALSRSSGDPQPVFKAIVDNAHRLCSAVYSILYRYDGQNMSVAASSRFSARGVAIAQRRYPAPPRRDHIVGRAIVEGRPMRSVDLTKDDRFPANQGDDFSRAVSRRAVLVVPLLRDGSVIGAISVGRAEAAAFTKRETWLLETFAEQAVIAIEKVRLFNETRDALERQTATADILRIISGSPTDVQPVFRAVAESAARLCDASNVHIRMVDGDVLRLALHIGDIRIPAAAAPINRTTAPGRAIIDRKIIHIHDITDPAVRTEYPDALFVKEKVVGGTFRTLLVVPLIRESSAIGTMSLRRREKRPFSEEQIKLLQTFADQAVIAIENARLFNETKEALEQQTGTAQVLSAISGSPTDVAPVYQTILENATRLCEASFAVVFLYDGEYLRAAAYRGASASFAQHLDEGRFRPSGETTTRLAALEKRIVEVEDLLNDPDFSPSEAHRAENARAVLSVPMLREGELVGVVTVWRREPRRFTDKQITLLKTFADQAVIAIENVRLFNETKEALEKQTATADILQVLSGSPSDTQPVFDAIVRHAARLCDSAYANVWRYDGEQLHLAASEGVPQDVLQSLKQAYPRVPDRSRVVGRVVHGRCAVRVNDTQTDPQYDKAYAGTLRLRRILGVPLLRAGQPLGVITISWAEPGPILPRHEDLLKTFADQAVIAIENVRLFNETKEALEQQTGTTEILKVISQSPTDTKPVFEIIAERAVKLCDAALGVVARFDGKSIHLVASHGVNPKATEMMGSIFPMRPEDETVMARTVRNRGIVHVADVLADATYSAKDVAAAADYRSSLGIPMMRGGEVIGGIFVARAKPGLFSDKQLALLQTFADQAVIAIENVRLFNETKEALDRQTATAEILKVIASSPADVQPVFEAIVRSGRSLFPTATIAVLVPEGGKIVLRAMAGADPDRVEKWRRAWPVPLAREYVTGAAILECKVVDIPDFRDAPDQFAVGARHATAFGYVAATVMPMVRVGAAIGAISVLRVTPGPLGERELSVLRTFADQAVIAIENVRLFNETKEALEQQTATAEILKVISSSTTDTQPVFEAIVQSAARLFAPCMVAVVMREGDVLLRKARAGPQPPKADPDGVASIYPLPFDAERSMAARSVIERRIIQVPDTEAEGLPPIVKSLGRAAGYRAITLVPLVKEGEGIGVIGLSRPEPGFKLTDKQLALVRTFADQAVIAIENVRLFKELQDRTEALTKSVGQLTALGQVGQAITSTLDLETVLKTIVSHAVELTGLDAGAVYEYDEGTEEFHLRAAENLGEEILEVLRTRPIRKGDGVVGRTAVTREPMQIHDTQDESYQSNLRELVIRTGRRALLAVPLMREDHIIGALTVQRNTPGPFAPEAVELLKTFATQSAMAIQNARLYREIEQKSRELETASKHKSQFLASMSHELRTPLNAILGFNEMILDQVYGEVPQDVKAPLENIQSSGKHLLRLINNVLDLAKIEAGRMELALSDYSVQDTVASVHSTLKPLAAEKGLQFVAEVPADIPPAHGDAGRLAQCLMNLAGNSLKFTKEGRVSIAVAQDNGLLRFSVTDTGIGIPADKIPNLFTEFKQTDATIASEYGGTGLGLSITKKFIEMHGGRIWVESEPGKGSTFLFEIPLRAAQ